MLRAYKEQGYFMPRVVMIRKNLKSVRELYWRKKNYIDQHVRDMPRSGIRDFLSWCKRQVKWSRSGSGSRILWSIGIFLKQSSTLWKRERPDTLRIWGGLWSRLGDPYRGKRIRSFGHSFACNRKSGWQGYVSWNFFCVLPSCHPAILMTQGVSIKIQTIEEDTFALNPSRLWDHWEPEVKMLVLNFPTNSTGGTLSREQL